MRKIPPELENPLDDKFHTVAEFLAPYFNKLNFTANTLTTISLITGVYSIYLYTQEKYVLSATYFMISYMFDCFDGFYARKYNMVTNFGDFYDHVKDWVVWILIMYFVYQKYSGFSGPKKYLPYTVIVFLLLSFVHVACQETVREDQNGDGNMILGSTKWACPSKTKEGAAEAMGFFKWFGTGTLNLYVALLILFSG